MTERDLGLQRLRALLAQFITDPAELSAIVAGAPILETASIDSITLLHLVVALENEFSVRFDETSLDGAFVDLRSLLAFVCGANGGGSP